MERATNQILQTLATAFNQVALSDKDQDQKLREKFFDKVNFKETKKSLDELGVPQELRYHIPREPADFKRLSDEARKARRNKFAVYKCFPASVTFRTSNKNKKLDTAIKTLGQHFQSNVKHNLGASIEIATSLLKIGKEFRKLIQEHSSVPQFFKQALQKGVDFNDPNNIEYIVKRLQHEFGLYRAILKDLHATYDKLEDLVFLQDDAAADGIEQIKHICLAIKNLRAAKDNVLPTREDFRGAQGGYRGRGGRYPFNSRGRSRRGRFHDRGRHPRYGRQYQYNDYNNYNNNQRYPPNGQQRQQ
mmetsp:Transcript_10992/g.21621  ORF Transcript_10992/g.21621 Transcript_10992/m.21621 type:complete len:303 (-) Transcript_10992:459-1367(-)